LVKAKRTKRAQKNTHAHPRCCSRRANYYNTCLRLSIYI
jgi:hypothetical protein